MVPSTAGYVCCKCFVKYIHSSQRAGKAGGVPVLLRGCCRVAGDEYSPCLVTKVLGGIEGRNGAGEDLAQGGMHRRQQSSLLYSVLPLTPGDLTQASWVLRPLNSLGRTKESHWSFSSITRS